MLCHLFYKSRARQSGSRGKNWIYMYIVQVEQAREVQETKVALTCIECQNSSRGEGYIDMNSVQVEQDREVKESKVGLK